MVSELHKTKRAVLKTEDKEENEFTFFLYFNSSVVFRRGLCYPEAKIVIGIALSVLAHTSQLEDFIDAVAWGDWTVVSC